MNYSELLKNIYEEVKGLPLEGKVASYIPQLANVSADKFGMSLLTVDGKEYIAPDCKCWLCKNGYTRPTV